MNVLKWRRYHLGVLAELRSIFDGDECQCTDPPEDHDPPEDPLDGETHADYCPHYLFWYLGQLIEKARTL